MKTRVLYVSHVSKISGSEVSLINLIRNLDQSKFEPYVLCQEEGLLTEELRKCGAKILFATFPQDYRDLSFVRPVWNLYKLLKPYRFHLIHANSFTAGFSIAMAAKLLRVPMICHIRDMIPEEFFATRVKAKLLKTATRVVCISTAVYEHMRAHGYADEQCVTVYNGVDLSLFGTDAEKAPLPVRATSGLKIGLVGQVIPWKGHDDFLDAAAMLREQGVLSDYYVIGSATFSDPQYIDDLQQKAVSLGIADIVHFIPFQPNIVSWMNALDVVTCPSWVEPFGRVVIEGMALQKPLVATNKGGPREIVLEGETGYLVEPKHPCDLARAFKKLIEHPDQLAPMGQKGRQRAQELFSIQHHVARVQALYETYSKKRG